MLDVKVLSTVPICMPRPLVTLHFQGFVRGGMQRVLWPRHRSAQWWPMGIQVTFAVSCPLLVCSCYHFGQSDWVWCMLPFLQHLVPVLAASSDGLCGHVWQQQQQQQWC